MFASADHVDVRVRCLLSRELHGNRALTTSLPPELLSDEPFQLEVKEEDVLGVGPQVVNTVLILVAIARAHCHDRRVQVLCGRLSIDFVRILLSLVDQFVCRCADLSRVFNLELIHVHTDGLRCYIVEVGDRWLCWLRIDCSSVVNCARVCRATRTALLPIKNLALKELEVLAKNLEAQSVKVNSLTACLVDAQGLLLDLLILEHDEE